MSKGAKPQFTLPEAVTSFLEQEASGMLIDLYGDSFIW